MDVKQHFSCVGFRAQELCESRGGGPGAPVANKPTVSVDVKQHSVSKVLVKYCLMSSDVS